MIAVDPDADFSVGVEIAAQVGAHLAAQVGIGGAFRRGRPAGRPLPRSEDRDVVLGEAAASLAGEDDHVPGRHFEHGVEADLRDRRNRRRRVDETRAMNLDEIETLLEGRDRIDAERDDPVRTAPSYPVKSLAN